MLFAMLRFVMATDTDRLVLGDAARDAGLPDDVARRGVSDLQARHLMFTDAAGSVLLHPLFAAVGHHWRREGTGQCTGSVGNVVSFDREFA